MGIIPPIQKYFILTDNIDAIIFINTFEKIYSKINSGLRINLDESIWLYCGYIIKEIKHGSNSNQIKNGISKLLPFDKVMIGVIEIMRNNTFEIIIEKRRYHFFIESLFDPYKGSRSTITSAKV